MEDVLIRRCQVFLLGVGFLFLGLPLSSNDSLPSAISEISKDHQLTNPPLLAVVVVKGGGSLGEKISRVNQENTVLDGLQRKPDGRFELSLENKENTLYLINQGKMKLGMITSFLSSDKRHIQIWDLPEKPLEENRYLQQPFQSLEKGNKGNENLNNEKGFFRFLGPLGNDASLQNLVYIYPVSDPSHPEPIPIGIDEIAQKIIFSDKGHPSIEVGNPRRGVSLDVDLSLRKAILTVITLGQAARSSEEFPLEEAKLTLDFLNHGELQFNLGGHETLLPIIFKPFRENSSDHPGKGFFRETGVTIRGVELFEIFEKGERLNFNGDKYNLLLEGKEKFKEFNQGDLMKGFKEALKKDLLRPGENLGVPHEGEIIKPSLNVNRPAGETRQNIQGREERQGPDHRESPSGNMGQDDQSRPSPPHPSDNDLRSRKQN
ncbi:MAG: hypothetical protein HYS07_11420 [Chlamydiae bacterium]|nr:hypothetical protein [Chlamydiota bacterium]MBI3278096.1 hypothetical protein [Chlamydiota bacterium]